MTLEERDVDQVVNEADSFFQRTLQISLCKSNYFNNSNISHVLFEIINSTTYHWVRSTFYQKWTYIFAKNKNTEVK